MIDKECWVRFGVVNFFSFWRGPRQKTFILSNMFTVCLSWSLTELLSDKKQKAHRRRRQQLQASGRNHMDGWQALTKWTTLQEVVNPTGLLLLSADHQLLWWLICSALSNAKLNLWSFLIYFPFMETLCWNSIARVQKTHTHFVGQA